MNKNEDRSPNRRSLFAILVAIVNRLKTRMSPPQLILIIFFCLIWVGALLLMLPYSSSSGQSIGLLDALFTATSAICVNGLVVLDTGSVFSTFGQAVIMILIQVGGLGFMTVGVMVAIIIGKRIGLRQRLIIQQATHSTSSQGLVKLSIYMVLIAFAFEALATLVLTWRWQAEMGWSQAAYYALFHSVSAFNNAGFALWSDSLTPFVGDPVVNITIILLYSGVCLSPKKAFFQNRLSRRSYPDRLDWSGLPLLF